VKAGDTLSGIATSFDLTLEELLTANPQITDPDKVGIGDEITIPAAPQSEFTDPSAEPSAAPS
jgi:LysM repeat protein